LFSDVGASFASAWRLPFVLEVNAPLLIERKRVEPLPLWSVAKDIEQEVFGQADAVLAVSEGVATYVRQEGADERRVYVVPNGVDTSRFHPELDARELRERLGTVDSLVVGFVGSLRSWHGVDLLIDAFARCARPDWRLLIVGDGPERQDLESQARESVLGGQISFTGPISHADIPLYIAAMDIPVAPYRWAPDFYFSPLKLYEYLAAGKAVIASDVGQIAGAIRHEENGYLVPPDDVPALSSALVRLADDAQLRERLGRQAPQGLMTWEGVAHQVTTILEGIKTQRMNVPV
jgi:glycosyltransferase involved in cell wall biosynthesis